MTSTTELQNRIQAWKDVNQFASDNSQFSINQLRWLIRNRKYNGLDNCLRKIGKRWYLNEDSFADWLDEKVKEEA